MKKFTVEIFTGTRFQLEIEADSKEDAINKAEKIYEDAEGDMESVEEAGYGECDHETSVLD